MTIKNQLYTHENGRIVIEHVRIKDDFLIWSKSYLNDEPVGVWVKYFDNGRLMSRLNYDQELNYTATTPDDAPYIDLYANKPMTEIDGTFQAPTLTEYPDGFASYFIKQMRYRDNAVTKRITGTVIVLISIDETGNTELIYINKEPMNTWDLEAARLIKELPKWTPCKINQQPSKVYAIVPIRLMLG